MIEYDFAKDDLAPPYCPRCRRHHMPSDIPGWPHKPRIIRLSLLRDAEATNNGHAPTMTAEAAQQQLPLFDQNSPTAVHPPTL
jgi:hypothetical protein